MLKFNAAVVSGLFVSVVNAQAIAQEYEVTPVISVGSIEPGDNVAGNRVGEVLVMNDEYLLIGAPGTDIDGVNNAGIVYVYDTATDSLLHTLRSPDPDANDEFGAAIALDGSLIAIGARNDDELVSDGGAVYLFDAADGAFIEKIFPDAPDEFDRFGISIAINESYICVGLGNDNDAGLNVGSVEVFDRNTRARLGKLLPDDPIDISSFGLRSAVWGDVLVVGAPLADIDGFNSGAVYVFDLGTMSQRYMVRGSDTAAGDEFGNSIAVSADRLYVGAERNDTDGDRSGAVYMFDLASGEELARMRPHDIRTNARFGSSLSVSGDDLVIGARRNSTLANNSGRVYLFNARTGQMKCRLGLLNTFQGDQLGVAVAAREGRVYASAFRSSQLGNFAGVVYRFDPGQFLFPDRTFIGRDCTLNDHDTLGLAIDLDGDLLVASGIEAGRQCVEDDTGGFFLYDIPTMTELHAVSQGVPNNPDDFGWSVAIGDGIIAVGAPSASAQVDEGGVVYLYDAFTAQLIRTIEPDDVARFDNFGFSLDIHQGLLAVGSPFVDFSGQSNAGRVYVYDIDTGGLVYTVTDPTPDSGGQFGIDVQLNAALLVVGAPGADEASPNAGAVFIFDALTGSHLQTLVSGIASTGLGHSVFTDGELVVTGDPSASVDGDARAGAIHVFDLQSGAELARLFSFSEEDVQFGWDVTLDESVIYAGKRFRLTNFNNDQPLIAPRVERFDRNTFEQLGQFRPSYSSAHAWFGQSLAVNEKYVAAGMPNAAFTSSNSSRGGAVFLHDKPQGNPCPVDLNNDGELNFFDISAFIVAFTSGDLAADFTGDGVLNFFDVSAFIVGFSAGCP